MGFFLNECWIHWKEPWQRTDWEREEGEKETGDGQSIQRPLKIRPKSKSQYCSTIDLQVLRTL